MRPSLEDMLPQGHETMAVSPILVSGHSIMIDNDSSLFDDGIMVSLARHPSENKSTMLTAPNT